MDSRAGRAAHELRIDREEEWVEMARDVRREAAGDGGAGRVEAGREKTGAGEAGGREGEELNRGVLLKSVGKSAA